jgi:uncharacterized protein DUF4160
LLRRRFFASRDIACSLCRSTAASRRTFMYGGKNKVAKIWLDPLSIAKRGGFSHAETKKIVKLVDEHRDYLLEKWNEFFSD